MKKWIVCMFLIVFFAFNLSPAIGASSGPAGPAPNSGDGISDGSGLDSPNGTNGGIDVGTGPAPNSGDGIPDGSGLDGPSGANGATDGGPGPAPNSGDGIPDGSGF